MSDVAVIPFIRVRIWNVNGRDHANKNIAVSSIKSVCDVAKEKAAPNDGKMRFSGDPAFADIAGELTFNGETSGCKPTLTVETSDQLLAAMDFAVRRANKIVNKGIVVVDAEKTKQIGIINVENQSKDGLI